jgi:arylsulfatase A-like enzyme
MLQRPATAPPQRSATDPPYPPILRAVLTALVAIIGSLTAVVAAPATPTDRRPNFILFIADDVGWDDLGAFGHPFMRTPAIDRLAREGIRFDNAILTISSCSPTRCSLLTGRYPQSAGAPDAHQPLPPDQVTFIDELRKAGYYTASVGKWHLGEDASRRFDRVIHDNAGSGADRWVEALQERPRGRPFFLWLAANDAHRPFGPGHLVPPYEREQILPPPFLPDIDETRLDLGLYYEKVTRLDSSVGRVLEALDAAGLTRTTLVLFLSDNGRPFPRCKTTLYDSGIKTPLIARRPGLIPPGSVSASLVSAVDIAPTVLAIAGLKAPATMQGVSFVPILKDPLATVREHAFAEQNWHDFAARQRCVRTVRTKYIRNFYPDLPNTPPVDALRTLTFQSMRRRRDRGELTPAQMNCFVRPRPAEELYDIVRDPFELRDIAGEPGSRPTLEALRRELARWQRETEDREPATRRPDEYDRDTGDRLPGAGPTRHGPVD